MPLFTTPDGRYTYAIETPGEGDGNSVVYDNWVNPGQMTPVWDRWGYEASIGVTQPATSPAPVPTAPIGGSRGHLIQVSDASDGELIPRMYSYWSSAWIGTAGTHAYVFVGHADGHPRFFQVTIATGIVQRFGSMLSYTGTAEGWYWDTDGWIYLLDGPRLRRVNPFTKQDRVIFDITDSAPGCRLWQAHSSDDGQTHSATVQRIVDDGPYPNISTVVCRNGGQLSYFPAKGTLDESQITSDGAYLIIKEDNDNRIIHLQTRDTRFLRNADGAVGHSDCGASIVIGEDDIHGECVLWDLRGPLLPESRHTLFHTWNMGHLSVKGDRCLLSDATHLSLVALDGSGVSPLLEHGMVGNDYDHQVQGNLDPTGRIACFLSNRGSGRFDLFLAVI